MNEFPTYGGCKGVACYPNDPKIKPVRLIRCIVRFDRYDVTTGDVEKDCRAAVVIPSDVMLPTMRLAATKALRRQHSEKSVAITGLRIARFAGVINETNERNAT
jgi:hypothetical protein